MKKGIVAAVMSFAMLATSSVLAQRTITLEELHKMSSSKKPQSEKKSEPGDTRIEYPKPESAGDNLKYLAEGTMSDVRSPFIFVARTKAAFAELKKLVPSLTEDMAVDFNKSAVVAAFSGEKMTGGYSVSMRCENAVCHVADETPVHGAIVTEALTYPYIVVEVPVEEMAPLSIKPGETWSKAMDRYVVDKGEFNFSGGFLGISKSFELEGDVAVLRNGETATLFFDVKRKPNETGSLFVEAGTGFAKNEEFLFERFEAGDLFDRPHTPLVVKLKMLTGRLEMEIKPGSRDYQISDGYEGRGSISAVKAM